VADQPRWDLVDLDSGRAWEVRAAARSGAKGSRAVYGTIDVGEFGYTVRDVAGSLYGPFPTLDDAAYALAAREEQGDPVLLGSPVTGAPVPADLPSETGAGGIGPAIGALGSGTSAAGVTAAVRLLPRRLLRRDRRTAEAVVIGLGVLLAALDVLAIVGLIRRRRRG
jgi:hypothetical protein